MDLTIHYGSDKVALELRQDGGIVDSLEASYYHDLSQVLLETLDRILKKNKIEHNQIASFSIEGDGGKESTAHKIVEAFIEGLRAPIQ